MYTAPVKFHYRVIIQKESRHINSKLSKSHRYEKDVSKRSLRCLTPKNKQCLRLSFFIGLQWHGTTFINKGHPKRAFLVRPAEEAIRVSDVFTVRSPRLPPPLTNAARVFLPTTSPPIFGYFLRNTCILNDYVILTPLSWWEVWVATWDTAVLWNGPSCLPFFFPQSSADVRLDKRPERENPYNVVFFWAATSIFICMYGAAAFFFFSIMTIMVQHLVIALI